MGLFQQEVEGSNPFAPTYCTTRGVRRAFFDAPPGPFFAQNRPLFFISRTSKSLEVSRRHTIRT